MRSNRRLSAALTAPRYPAAGEHFEPSTREAPAVERSPASKCLSSTDPDPHSSLLGPISTTPHGIPL